MSFALYSTGTLMFTFLFISFISSYSTFTAYWYIRVVPGRATSKWMPRVFCQVLPCCLRRSAKEKRQAGDSMPAQPVETEKTAVFSNGRRTRYKSLISTHLKLNQWTFYSWVYLFWRCRRPGCWPEKQRTSQRDLRSATRSTVPGESSTVATCGNNINTISWLILFLNW